MDETPLQDEPAAALVLRLARGKARKSRQIHSDEPVILGADTIVLLDGRVFGKAGSQDEALCMLANLSGRSHTVLTAVAVSTPRQEIAAVSETRVQLRNIDPDEALRYWQSGEPAGKAGAYAIQGIGGIFVESLTGSWSGVVGLPVFETARLLRKAGVEVLSAASSSRR